MINDISIKIIGKLDLEFGDAFDHQKVRQIIDEVIYQYDFSPKETLPATLDNMNELVFMYLASKKIDGLSDNTLKTYGRRLLKFGDKIKKNAETITTMDIRIHLATYSKTGIKMTTLATETDILRGFFKWLEVEEYIVKSPMHKIKTPKVESRIRDALTKEQFEILRGGATTFRERALLELMYSTGCRLDEIVNIKKSHIDWQRLQLKVIGKGNKERVVFLNATSQVYLNRYLESRTDKCESLFVTERKPYSKLGRRAVQREISKILKKSELSINVYPHLIRHTFATHMINSGMSLNVLQEILGHDSPDTTLIYANIDNKTIEHEYRKYS